ncbi:MAG: hypothetical protein JXQ90_15090 [Cyclobacteriaceae bacterium]
MKQLYLILALLVTGLVAQGQSLSDLDSANFFDFWVGEWNAAWDEGKGVEVYGTNSITHQLDGKVINEQFRITGGQNAGIKGTSNSVFQPRTNTWRQGWADNQGGYFDFIGQFDGDKRMFSTHPRQVGADMIVQRMVFYDIKEESMTWDWEISRDGGKTWSLSWRIFYTRK